MRKTDQIGTETLSDEEIVERELKGEKFLYETLIRK
jgi:hypothetical protein